MRPTAALLSAAIVCLASPQPSADAKKPWWQRGADTWYYKDDWKALAVTPLRGGREPAVTKTLKLDEAAKSGWIVVWGDRGYRLLVNGRPVGQSVDGGLIDDYDLTKLVAGKKEIALRIEGRKVAAEGEIVDANDDPHAFLTGPDWQDTRGGGPRRLSPRASLASRGSASRGSS
jgi:hypothetical protein